MDKKGVVEVDWIVSIGIFLIFLAIFFIYLTPFSSKQPDLSDSLLSGLETNLRNNATWHVSRIPIVIDSNVTAKEPVIVPFLFTWTNISFSDNTTFFRNEDKLIFSPQLGRGTNIKWIVSSNEPYPQPEVVADLAPTPYSVLVDSQQFSADFSGIPVSARHFGKERLSDFNLTIEEVQVSEPASDKESNFTNFAAKYKLVAEQLNHTTFVVSGFSRMYNYITTDKLEMHNVTVSVSLHNYTNYYIDNELLGPFNSTTDSCISKFASYIDFYDETSGASFIAYEGSDISFCTGNGTARLSMRMKLEDETPYSVIFHSGGYEETINYTNPYLARMGLAENLTGLSSELLTRLTSSDYQSLKTSWGFPSQRDFAFQLVNESNEPILNYTPTQPGVVNTFVREFSEVLLDKYGTKTKRKLRLKAW